MRSKKRPTWTSGATERGLDSRNQKQLDALKERLNIRVEHDPSPLHKIHNASKTNKEES